MVRGYARLNRFRAKARLVVDVPDGAKVHPKILEFPSLHPDKEGGTKGG